MVSPLNLRCVTVLVQPLCNVVCRWFNRSESGNWIFFDQHVLWLFCSHVLLSGHISLHWPFVFWPASCVHKIFPSSNHQELQLQHKGKLKWPEVCVNAVGTRTPTVLLAFDVMLNTSRRLQWTVARTSTMWSLSPGYHRSSWEYWDLSCMNDFN